MQIERPRRERQGLDVPVTRGSLGLPVRYLEGVGNRSKPGGCCGAHYGANEAAWKAFVADVKAFLAKTLGP